MPPTESYLTPRAVKVSLCRTSDHPHTRNAMQNTPCRGVAYTADQIVALPEISRPSPRRPPPKVPRRAPAIASARSWRESHYGWKLDVPAGRETSPREVRTVAVPVDHHCNYFQEHGSACPYPYQSMPPTWIPGFRLVKRGGETDGVPLTDSLL